MLSRRSSLNWKKASSVGSGRSSRLRLVSASAGHKRFKLWTTYGGTEVAQWSVTTTMARRIFIPRQTALSGDLLQASCDYAWTKDRQSVWSVQTSNKEKSKRHRWPITCY
jgi:hypothetical protein